MSLRESPEEYEGHESEPAKSSSLKRVVRLARVIATDIDWAKAKTINGILPGFLDAYEAVQDEWEKNPENREVVTGNLIHTVEISRRLRQPNS